ATRTAGPVAAGILLGKQDGIRGAVHERRGNSGLAVPDRVPISAVGVRVFVVNPAEDKEVPRGGGVPVAPVKAAPEAWGAEALVDLDAGLGEEFPVPNIYRVPGGPDNPNVDRSCRVRCRRADHSTPVQPLRHLPGVVLFDEGQKVEKEWTVEGAAICTRLGWQAS